MVSLLALILVICLVVPKAGRGENNIALTDAYACLAASSPESEMWCDLWASLPVVLQDGVRFTFEFRRQIVLLETESGLKTAVGSSVRGP